MEAIAAPFTPSFGKPKLPKIKSQSSRTLVTVRMIAAVIRTLVRPIPLKNPAKARLQRAKAAP